MARYERSIEADGMAALGICESLILALTELDILTEEEVRGVLRDVADTQEKAALSSLSPEKHKAVVEIVQRILAGKNGDTALKIKRHFRPAVSRFVLHAFADGAVVERDADSAWQKREHLDHGRRDRGVPRAQPRGRTGGCAGCDNSFA